MPCRVRIACLNPTHRSHSTPYAPPGGETYGDVCPAGYYCPEGAANPTVCPLGTYYSGVKNKGALAYGNTTTYCELCPASYACDTTGLSTCVVVGLH